MQSFKIILKNSWYWRLRVSLLKICQNYNKTTIESDGTYQEFLTNQNINQDIWNKFFN